MKLPRRLVGLAYVAPALLFVAVFVAYPLVRLVMMSTTNSSLLGGEVFVGWSNYLKAFQDETFWQSLGFTLKYTLLITPILMIGGFLLALLTAGSGRLSRSTRAIVFLPVVIGLGSSSILWVGLLDEQVGLVGRLLHDLGLVAQPPVWFVDADRGLWAVILSVVWKVIGFGTLLFVAGLQRIGEDIGEAAMIDGAGYWQRVRYITLPLMVRTMLLTTLISVVGSLLAFDQFYIMTSGGPGNQTFSSVYWIYQNSFIYFKQGYGAALSVVLLAIVLAVSIGQILVTRWVPEP
ncbi:MAG TPA: sugar ABC transporter permease [Burkholderiaceae bacterium]|nr:sugar ABC transporter permease [Burkholderiaceae bacterium]